MTELLAPAGNFEGLKAAVSSGCDAVYLGMQKFGARAYSDNFDEESLAEAVKYAHIRNVKVYVTMNTIVFEDEIEDMEKQLDFLNEAGVDGIIIQDMAVFEYVKNNYPDMEPHCSTQMGIDDLEGTLLWKELGAKRVVLARETDIDTVKEIRRVANIPIEVFVHGALCVSYSGNCLMSGLIGYRSGNRGRCVGSCRKPYELIEEDTGTGLGNSYILSTKDLNTAAYIDRLEGIDSLKIEGRMKEPAYIANVVSRYRKALDGTATEEDLENLKKTFNRTYTCGYMFGEDKKDITNVARPNHFGYEIGRVTGKKGGSYRLSLKETLYQNDIIRIDRGEEDVVLSVVKLYDDSDRLINRADRQCYIKIRENLKKGDKVYKTRDYNYYKGLEELLGREFRHFDLNLRIYAYPGSKLVINASGLGVEYFYESEEILEEAVNKPTDREQVLKQMGRLGDTVFKLGEIEFEEWGAFIPAGLLNRARRDIVQGLYSAKIEASSNCSSVEAPAETEKADTRVQGKERTEAPYITASVSNAEQYRACKEAGIKEIYFHNIVRRNENKYGDMEGKLLIGGYGGLYRYRNSNPFVTDYSFNVVNSTGCRALLKQGAERVTLSYELNREQLTALADAYYEAEGNYPALEMIVYGRAPLMFTKYCPLKKNGLCGRCRKHSYLLKDEYGTFPVVNHEDCTVTILNGKILNLLDEMPDIKHVEAFRLNFTTESPAEVRRIADKAIGKLEGRVTESLFNRKTDTRGHFNKEIM